MAPFHALTLTAAAARTAVGGSVEQTAASIRAGISRFDAHALHEALSRDPGREAREPLTVAAAPGVDPALRGAERLHALLLPVLADLVESAGLERRDLAECALLLALPAPDEAVATWHLAETFALEIARRTGLVFKASRQSLSGHAAALELLGEASALLASGAAQTCLVAGVDTYLSEDRLALLDEGYRLKSARNVDGFCPGEAAAALLVEGARSRRGATPRATITALGLGLEPEPMRSEKVSTGVGLVQALRGALPGEGSPDLLLCDLNGESYRAFEWGTAQARLGARLEGLRRAVMPAQRLGDIGAATGALLVATAAEAFARGWAPGEEALIFTASEGPLRAAARVTRPGPKERRG
jgi:3-oxoacyl-[acyl-carrier-protein] synthase I